MSASESKREQVPLARLIREPWLQLRAGCADGLTDPATVERYWEAIVAGEEFPPLGVVSDGNVYWLFDGFQRAAAFERAGRDSVACEVYPGSRLDALFRALSANARHGLTRTTSDCRRVVTTVIQNSELLQMVLARAPEVGGVSRALASACCVSKGLVAKVLDEHGLRVVAGQLVKKRTVSIMDSSSRNEAAAPTAAGHDANAQRTPSLTSSSNPDIDLSTTNLVRSPESLASSELEKARRALTLLWNACRVLLDGPYSSHLLWYASQHKVSFTVEQPDGSLAPPSASTPLSTYVWWSPVRQIEAVLSDLSAVAYGGLGIDVSQE